MLRQTGDVGREILYPQPYTGVLGRVVSLGPSVLVKEPQC